MDSSDALIWHEAFLAGSAGAFVVYIALYRTSRLADLAKNFSAEPVRVFLFDLVAFLICGGLVAAFLGSSGLREAFFAGSTWQGIVGGALAGTELRALQQHVQHQQDQEKAT